MIAEMTKSFTLKEHKQLNDSPLLLFRGCIVAQFKWKLRLLILFFANPQTKCIFVPTILRGGAVVARWAHNPKAASSNLAPATEKSLA
jgi:hypothetical protein